MTDKHRLTILVADDTDTDRLILTSIVESEGHRVLSARDGIEAVDIFTRERPDLVLLDALMPRLDGFGAARKIKALAGEELVPIIFLTSLTDTESLVQCLDAGGDDFLSKPYNRVILQAKIKSFYRMRELHSTMLEQRNQIALHNEHFMQEQTVAKQVFDNIAHSGCLDANNVKYYLSSLAIFNGDIMLAAMRPSGSMMVLLGDFTGHGLPAAVGAMPLASVFYGMVPKGFAMTDILREMNSKLKTILPVGIFCCATMVDINFRKQEMRVWNGGLPECFIYRGDTLAYEPIVSRHLPLGVLSDKDFRDDCITFPMALGDRLYIWSDGIHEARNPEGDMFGEERLQAVFDHNTRPERLYDEILDRVQNFIGQGERNDDLSLIEILMAEPQHVNAVAAEAERRNQSTLAEWGMSFDIQPASFRMFDPLPLLLNILVEVPGLRGHSGTLYTIISELYSNALEHGILALDSSLKETQDGFTNYYQQRQERLNEVSTGFVRLHLHHCTTDEGGTLTIRVEDSGPGFTGAKSQVREEPGANRYGGRGVALVDKLCDAVRYLGEGNEVEAVFSWRNDE
ncbi:fused response regulator/phosphatase [Marinimicrobium sp. ABcell2]|uniref:ATP-binding SpoIIE family protein phosphatase n=1 Tax=Marinimicrobium sp. ABcell2 TaxID=3069751 RepID=UPI0027AE9AF0|nr:fused response regulator/phosphatase [Marinimicrobium sp. ABcell2]MDQ2078091.1 fused response regulator/phosphatase [Marinimicrobium sp. ABcell2]